MYGVRVAKKCDRVASDFLDRTGGGKSGDRGERHKLRNGQMQKWWPWGNAMCDNARWSCARRASLLVFNIPAVSRAERVTAGREIYSGNIADTQTNTNLAPCFISSDTIK